VRSVHFNRFFFETPFWKRLNCAFLFSFFCFAGFKNEKNEMLNFAIPKPLVWLKHLNCAIQHFMLSNAKFKEVFFFQFLDGCVQMQKK